LLGRYEVIEQLAQGGMGAVYKVLDVRLQRIGCLKIMPAESGDGDERFLREMRALGRLVHPGIVPVYDVGVAEGQRFVLTAFVEGRSLDDLLTGRPLPADKVAQVTREIAVAVGYAHGCGILHRDLNPSNVLLDGTGRVHVGGFTPPAPPRGEQLTASGTVMGRPEYLAPERVVSGAVGPAADVYALGVLLYELLTGRLPIQGRNPLETLLRITQEEVVAPHVVNPAVDRTLEAICLRCLAKRPEDRYRSMQEVAQALAGYAAGIEREAARSRALPSTARPGPAAGVEREAARPSDLPSKPKPRPAARVEPGAVVASSSRRRPERTEERPLAKGKGASSCGSVVLLVLVLLAGSAFVLWYVLASISTQGWLRP
jgi:serine/threonine protein kinase